MSYLRSFIALAIIVVIVSLFEWINGAKFTNLDYVEILAFVAFMEAHRSKIS